MELYSNQKIINYSDGFNTQAEELAEVLNEYQGDNWHEDIDLVYQYGDQEATQEKQLIDALQCLDGSYVYWDEGEECWLHKKKAPKPYSNEWAE